jgi:hypothetical protein
MSIQTLEAYEGSSLTSAGLERLNHYISIFMAIQTIVRHSGVGMDIA